MNHWSIWYLWNEERSIWLFGSSQLAFSFSFCVFSYGTASYMVYTVWHILLRIRCSHSLKLSRLFLFLQFALLDFLSVVSASTWPLPIHRLWRSRGCHFRLHVFLGAFLPVSFHRISNWLSSLLSPSWFPSWRLSRLPFYASVYGRKASWNSDFYSTRNELFLQVSSHCLFSLISTL